MQNEINKQLKINFIQPDICQSKYDWINIDLDNERVGKVRALRTEEKLTIFSINIFPEFERNGLAKKVIQTFKHSYQTIVADRVRYSAIGFWEKMGFYRQDRDTYLWQKTNQ